MIAASLPVQRAADAKLLVVDRARTPRATGRARDFARLFDAGDLVIANDAATLPASLPDGTCRPARRSKCAWPDASRSTSTASTAFSAVLFGAGDFRMRTEDRPAATTGRSRATAWRSARSGRRSSASARSPASGRAASSRARRQRSGKAWRGTAGRSSMRTCRSRWRSGTPGRRSPARRSRSSRLRPASRSTGRRSRR